MACWPGWATVRRDKATCFRELEEASRHEDAWIRNMAVLMTAMFRENEGDVDQMAADLAIALDGFRTLGDRWGTSLALRGLSSYQTGRGDHHGALASLTEAMRLVDELGTSEGVAQLLAQSALSRSEVDDHDGARADLRRSLQLSEEHGSRGGQAIALTGFSVLARREGRLDEAKELADRGYSMLDLQAERLSPHGQAIVLGQLARVAVARGELADARAYAKQAVDLALRTEDMPVLSATIEAAADVELLAGELELAARTLGIAAALRGIRAVPDSDVRRTVERLRVGLGDERYEATYDASASLARDDAIDELRKRLDLSATEGRLGEPGGSIRAGAGPAGSLRTPGSVEHE